MQCNPENKVLQSASFDELQIYKFVNGMADTRGE